MPAMSEKESGRKPPSLEWVQDSGGCGNYHEDSIDWTAAWEEHGRWLRTVVIARRQAASA